MTHTIRGNLIFSYSFHGPSCSSIALDHDDESSQYIDERNALVHGGVKFFDGIDRTAHNNLILYSQGVMHGYQCLHALTGTLNLSSAHTHFESNHCVMLPGQNPYTCDWRWSGSILQQVTSCGPAFKQIFMAGRYRCSFG